jgi:hypothetical protein
MMIAIMLMSSWWYLLGVKRMRPQRKVCADHNVVLAKAPPSVLKPERVSIVSSVPVRLPSQETGWLLDSSQIVTSIQSF